MSEQNNAEATVSPGVVMSNLAGATIEDIKKCDYKLNIMGLKGFCNHSCFLTSS